MVSSEELLVADIFATARPETLPGAGVLQAWGIAQESSSDHPPWEVLLLDGSLALFTLRSAAATWDVGDRVNLVRIARGSWRIDSVVSTTQST